MEQKRKKTIKKSEGSLKNLRDIINQINIYALCKSQKEKKERESIFKEIMTKNFTNLREKGTFRFKGLW